MRIHPLKNISVLIGDLVGIGNTGSLGRGRRLAGPSKRQVRHSQIQIFKYSTLKHSNRSRCGRESVIPRQRPEMPISRLISSCLSPSNFSPLSSLSVTAAVPLCVAPPLTHVGMCGSDSVSTLGLCSPSPHPKKGQEKQFSPHPLPKRGQEEEGDGSETPGSLRLARSLLESRYRYV